MTKAATLTLLASGADAFVVDPFVRLTVRAWVTDLETCLGSVLSAGLEPRVVVRSAADVEDSPTYTGAGVFYSELDVPVTAQAVEAAVQKVLESYHAAGRPIDHTSGDEILVQRQALDVVMSGVVVTCDPETGGPYSRVDFDALTGRTNEVTAGKACRTVFLHDGLPLPVPWAGLREAVARVVRLCATDTLLIEFALDRCGVIHIFQARPAPFAVAADGMVVRRKHIIIHAAKTLARKADLWSDMADWNPAEMLGDRPARLDSSLYQAVISNRIWAIGRASLGYARPSTMRLIDLIAGKPYVRIQSSFESLLPAALDIALQRRLVADRMTYLRERAHLHDKVEFDVLFTAGDTQSLARVELLLGRGFNRADIDQLSAVLREHTGQLVTRTPEVLEKSISARTALVEWRDCHRWEDAVGSLAHATEYLHGAARACSILGTFHFVRVARLAFHSLVLLQRLQEVDMIDDQWLMRFWQLDQSPAAEMAQAGLGLSDPPETRDAFYRRFGHLRPNTYDVTSSRYDSLRLENDVGRVSRTPKTRRRSAAAAESWAPPLSRAAGLFLREAGVMCSPDEFVRMARGTLAEREQSKFVFSSVLSDMLECIAGVAAAHGFSREEVRHVPFGTLLASRRLAPTEASARLRRVIDRNQQDHAASLRLRMPAVIRSAEDLALIHPEASQPNFVGSLMVEAPILEVTKGTPLMWPGVDGTIVAVEAADPGFEWLFACGAVGLVTQYGGLGSHMAVRSAELGVPAVVGCGRTLFAALSRAKRLRIDAAQRQLSWEEESGKRCWWGGTRASQQDWMRWPEVI